jgi:hypothetical protein
MRSSFGLFGIIFEVTFRVRPLVAMAVYHRRYSLDEFTRELTGAVGQGRVDDDVHRPLHRRDRR